ncbi:competence type IV pilus assembly protein ComGB [Pradoshia sp.]
MKLERNRRWKGPEQARFLTELGDLLENGFSLYEGIEFSMLHGRKNYQEDIKDSMVLLKEGHSFRDFLEWLSFEQELVGLVSYGEQNGQLPATLKEAGRIWQKKCEDRAKLRNLLVYPAFLFLFTFGLLQLFTTYLFPRFSQMYEDYGLGSNPFMETAGFISNLVRFSPVLIALACILLSFLHHYYLKKLPQLKREYLFMKIPYIRRYRQLSITYYFSIQLGSLLQGGLSVLDALEFMKKQDPKLLVREIAEQMMERLKAGDELEDIFRKTRVFKDDFNRIISHGQKNGLLGEELLYYSRLVLKEMEGMTEKTLKTIQPLMFGLVALLVILLYLAILMPMISLMNSI